MLAAHRAGFKRVIIPRHNERDLPEIPEAIRNELEIIAADDVRDVINAALEADPLPGPVEPRSGSGTNTGASTPVSAAHQE